MKKLPCVLVIFAAAIFLLPTARAVYAPIPPVEQGKLLTVYLGAGFYYDTNIFGAPENGIESFVFQVQPTLVANVSSGDQTFLTASYQPSVDYIENRPGTKLLVSHSISARVAHTFTPRLEGEISDTFQIVKNPESLLPGIGGGILNPDQSYDFNQFNGKLAYSLNQRTALKGKVRLSDFAYDNEFLSINLDHGEYIGGVELVRNARENLQVSAEYRYQAIRYRHGGEFKDKNSHFLFAGADYAATKRTALSARLGVEALHRKSADDGVLPYVELGVKHDYRNDSFVSAGYTFSVQETSNINAYTDAYTHQFFVNVQHAIKKNFVLSGSADWQPSQLNGREDIATDINESNLKLGVAFTYSFRSRWSLSTTCDIDHVESDDSGRNLDRARVGLRGRWIF